MAISTEDGKISFYIIEASNIRLASNMRPTPNSFVDEFLFLDNLTGENKKNRLVLKGAFNILFEILIEKVIFGYFKNLALF